MALKTTPFDPADYLATAEHCAHYLTDALESNDIAEIADSFGIVARACGMAEIAKKAGLSREGLYKTLSEKGTPGISTTLHVMQAVGVQLVAQPAGKTKRVPGRNSASKPLDPYLSLSPLSLTDRLQRRNVDEPGALWYNDTSQCPYGAGAKVVATRFAIRPRKDEDDGIVEEM